MANFLALVDPDPKRRASYLARAADLLDVVPGLRRGSCTNGAFATVWSAADSAPISATTDAHGAGVVWGDALTTDGAPANAATVRRAWQRIAPHAPDPWDGFYAGVTYDSTGSLVAGADLFGLFPVYYWSSNEVVLVGSSIPAFRAHPSLQSRFNPLGLAGILLTGGSLEGETLWMNVRRLAPGHLLTWSSGSHAREVRQYVFPTEETLADREFDEHVAMLDGTLDQAIVRHVGAGGPTCILLSGGRDSRVVAGLMHRRGLHARALTLGRPDDYDAQCASAVAKTLRLPHTVAPDAIGDVAAIVARHLQHEQLTNGMSNFYSWGILPLLPACGSRVLSGYWLEALIGGEVRRLPDAHGARDDPGERVMQKALSYGLAPDRLRRLVRPEVFGDAIDECLDRMRRRYAALDGDADRRSWQFVLRQRARFHAGSTPWRLSLRSWPGLLVLDRSLLRLCASFPMSTLLDRRAEDHLLRTRFPALARLPLDRDSHRTDPVLVSAAWRARRFVVERMPFVMRGQYRRESAAGERRRYHRLFDINAPMWRAARQLAEPARRGVTDLFDPGELQALLPHADVPVEPPYPVAGSNGLKTLIGFLIWWRDHA